MSDQREVPCYKKTFEYCSIHWRIDSFYFLESPDGYILYSSEFSVRFPELTKWRLGLKSHWTEDRVNILSFLLERLESDAGPAAVWVNWIVAVADEEDREHFSVECESNFTNNDSREFDLTGFPDIYGIFQGYEPEAILFRCRMIVDHNHDAQERIRFIDTDISLELLSEDLRRTYNRSRLCDIVLKIPAKDEPMEYTASVRAHRSILSARNTRMCEMIGPGGVLYLDEELDPNALGRVVRYLYTGNFYYIFVNPTVALYRCMLYFDMGELSSLFSKRRYVLLTEITGTRGTLKWTIRNPETGDSYKVSETMRRVGSSEEWRLHLYRHSVGNDRFSLDVFLEYVNGTSDCLDVCVKFFIYNRFNQLVNGNRRFGNINLGERLGVLEFLRNSSLSNFLRQGDLVIVAKVEIFNHLHISVTGSETATYCPPIVPVNLYYAGLSVNILQLYRVSAYSDITLVAEEIGFEAHKCILAARSTFFSSVFPVWRKRALAMDMTASTLQSLLEYIYSGNLELNGAENLMRLYKAGFEYGIESLKSKCSKGLIDELTPNTVTRILVLAEDHEDQQLKSAALYFIWMLQIQSSGGEMWLTLADERPELFQDIINYLERRNLEAAQN